jgi:uncharacterized protein (DUF2236 family)
MSAVAPVDTEEDFGLFGPMSVTWRVHLEPVLWVGGIRALYLQALHPWVIRGIAQNSALFDRDRAWRRFQRTAEFVGIRTFGTTEAVARAGQRVRRLHARLRGYGPTLGRSSALMIRSCCCGCTAARSIPMLTCRVARES